MKRLSEQINYIKKNLGQARKLGKSALILLLCVTLTGCNNILGDGEVSIVTAPPIVTPKVTVVDGYGQGEKSRFDIGGTDAFYLLPGIENHPDYFQDFMCLDYTEDGYFVYYYCAPAYITDKEIVALKDGQEHDRPEGDYPEIDRSKDSKIDAMILMAYNPDTRKYKVIDAQAYSDNTANSATGGQANTGVDFYKSPNYDFYILSHCYGCRVAGTGEYFIMDQGGYITVYDTKLNQLSKINFGRALDVKIKQVENQLKGSYKGKNTSDIASDFGDGDDGDKDEMEDSINELSNATGETFDSGRTSVDNLKLNYLIKSAVMDDNGKIYISMMIYTGESPWATDVLFNRVCCLTSYDLTGNYASFVSENESFGMQAALYQAYAKDGADFDQIRQGIVGGKFEYQGKQYNQYVPDSFTPFSSEKEGDSVFLTGITDTTWVRHFRNRPMAYNDYVYEVVGFALRLLDEYIKGISFGQRVAEVRKLFRDSDMLPAVYGYERYKKDITADLPIGESKSNNHHQSLFITTVFENELISKDGKIIEKYRSPRLLPILNHEDESVRNSIVKETIYIEPYRYNPEIPIYDESYNYVNDSEKSKAIVNNALLAIKGYTNDTEVNVLQVIYNYIATGAGYSGLFDYIGNSIPNLNGSGNIHRAMGTYGITEEMLYMAAMGQVLDTENPVKTKNEKLTIKEGSFPISYKVVFPKGSYIEAVDMNETEGSSTSSIYDGVLLFNDDATDTKVGLKYTSTIRYKKEAGDVFTDSGVPGSAIDTGTLDYIDEDTKVETSILMLITNQGVKFYTPIVVKNKGKSADGTTKDIYNSVYSNDANRCVYIENEKLLSSTGFTPYTESGTQAAVSERIDNADISEEKYKDDNQVVVTQKDLTLSLNSSRVGTLQSSSSFTALGDNRVLISAYDSGLSLLKLNVGTDSKGKRTIGCEVLNLHSGSYYQSFLDKKSGDYKVIGFDTEEYMYGSMDLARAKVYNYAFDKAQDEIYDAALRDSFDQMAIDYVRRLHRTRVDIEEDSEGNITAQKTVILSFSDDHSEEAESERKLFALDENAARAEMERIIVSKGALPTDEYFEYVKTLREKVNAQQQALNEIFELTRANQLGDTDKDPYWVGLKERLQNTTEMSDLKDILAEIVTEESMVSKFAPDDVEIYQEFRKTLNYKEEEQKQNETLAETKLTAQELDELIKNKKTAKDYEEQYDEVKRVTGEEVKDPLNEALNTDGIMTDPSEKDIDKPDRMRIRALIIEDIENEYFVLHPLEPEKIYAPDGSYEMAVNAEKEDEIFEQYLTDLLHRINPNNLAAARQAVAEYFAELSFNTARTYENGKITDNPLKVSDETKEKMKKEILDGMENCETIADVEELFFGTQVNNLGNPYGSYRDSFSKWKKDSETLTSSEKAKTMRSSGWYQKLKEILLSDKELSAKLESRDQSWEDYIQSIYSNNVGNVLRDEQTGETQSAYTTAAGSFAQLVEFMCENAGEVNQQTKINMVEDLLIGFESITTADTAEEAVLIEMMTLPAYQGYMAEYEAFNKRDFTQGNETDNSSNVGNGQNPVSVTMSSEGSIRRKELVEQEFYKKTIGSLKESELLKSYLESNDETFEEYMASLPTLASDENITDPAASAAKIYETFEPYEPIPEDMIPSASTGDEERPVAYGESSGNAETPAANGESSN
ncbi:hypothetical protein [Butyrivibrio sp. WCD3002]|uniref:hypothetical protein n=1 Tax=Butyrivibrio sp. WCD3002 TaxID=1280676 RepID=UPI0004123B68|nr:hypothetical protein [Butyrivibrio sp. WCD3002]